MKVKAVILALVAVGLVSACGGLSEGEKKALVLEFKERGDAAEQTILKQFPDDERNRSEKFRASIDRIRKEVLKKYGVTEEEAREIFREGRQKGWW